MFTQARATAKWCATPRPGTSTTRTICASRCASSSMRDDFVTIHHELGHNYYQRAYKQQPYLYLNGANDGFHEAIGDFIALSITPEYLVQIGLLDRAARCRSPTRTSACCCARRWTRSPSCRSACWSTTGAGACSTARSRRPSTTQPGSSCSLEYQGITPPVASGRRTPSIRAPSIHIPGNMPYTRYFLARHPPVPVLQGGLRPGRLEGPAAPLQLLRQQGSRPEAQRDAGDGRVQAVARRARSLHRHPRRCPGKAMVEYFAPLKAWLDEQNAGKQSGW